MGKMDEAADYFQQSTDWEASQVQAAEKSEKRAWKVAGAAIVMAVVEGLALYGLTPLKTTEPYVIRVNETTGVVDVVKSVKNAKTTWEEVVRKADLRKYVRARESYSRALAPEFYKRVGLMSSREEADRYQLFYNPKLNKKGDSPLTLYGENGSVEIKIKSVSFLNDKAASVNYIKTTRADNLSTTQSETSEWVATVTYKYVAPPDSEDDREINEHGFQATEYRNDPVSPDKNEAK